MKSVSIFCGSQDGSKPEYLLKAREVGKSLASLGITIVYGGASVGLMGAVATAALDAGGTVIGVIPKFLLDRESAHHELSEMIVVDSMHERKSAMFERSQGMIALPGGVGTLDELVEIISWGSLNFHQFPIGLYNLNGFYSPLIRMLQVMKEEGFMRNGYCDNKVFCEDSFEKLWAQMQQNSKS
jgi:uncharacterized protein (TIGR00730 family)